VTRAGRWWRTVVGASCAGAVALISACGHSARDVDADAQSGATPDGSVPDAGAPALFDDAGTTGQDAGARADEGLDPSDTAQAQCFDGDDQDGDEQVDCADPGCSDARVCCVGSTAEACCAASPIVTRWLISECAPGPADRCGALGARSVSGAPQVSADGGLVMVAAGSVDAIVDLPELAVVPRAEGVRLRATISAPARSDQLDATAFGLWSPRASSATVTPIVAAVVSATRGDVSLLVGGRVVQSTALVEGTSVYVLEVRPDGAVTLEGAGEPLASTVELPEGAVTPVVFGRVTNDAFVPAPTRLRELVLERSPCDIPNALQRAGEGLLVDGGARYDEGLATDPSVLADGSGTRVAFVVGGAENAPHAIFVGERGADGQVTAAAEPLRIADVRSALAPAMVTDLGGPHLFVDGTLSMYFAYESDGGLWRLGRVDDVDGARTITSVALVDGSFDDPALLPDGRLLARERLAGGGSRIVALTGGELSAPASGLCASESACGEGRTDDYLHEPSSDPLAFDHDEVRAPVAIAHDGVVRIYYAGRRGTRWSIGMLLMGPDGTYFRRAGGGLPVLAPGTGALDALGVAGPAPHVVDGHLELLHAGTDGARWRLLAATQPVRGL
jgi:hypothetical protein